MPNKPRIVELELVYRAYGSFSRAEARAMVRARLTKTQIVVESGDVTWRDKDASVQLHFPLRFHQQTGQPIPKRFTRTWRLADCWRIKVGHALMRFGA